MESWLRRHHPLRFGPPEPPFSRVRVNVLFEVYLCAAADRWFPAEAVPVFRDDSVWAAAPGGDVPAGTLITEEYLLELEREAFVRLCGQKKTLERIQHMLKKGKPLRN